MKTYLVFEPADGGKNSETAEKIIFLREKFSWPALLLTPFWLLWHRLWIAFLVWTVLMIAVGVLVQMLGLHPVAAAAAFWLPSFVAGFEATELRRRKLIRKKYRDAGVVVALELEDAERKFFEEWAKNGAASESAPSAPGSLPPASKASIKTSIQSSSALAPGPVIGLFPEPGARR